MRGARIHPLPLEGILSHIYGVDFDDELADATSSEGFISSLGYTIKGSWQCNSTRGGCYISQRPNGAMLAKLLLVAYISTS